MTDMTAVMTASPLSARSCRTTGRPVGRALDVRPGGRASAGRSSLAIADVPSCTIYVRRRLLVGAVALLLGLVAWSGADSVFANRGGDPASAPVVGGTSMYVVESGDSLWSIAEAHRGATPIDDYVDQLLVLNGSPVLFVGEVITLP